MPIVPLNLSSPCRSGAAIAVILCLSACGGADGSSGTSAPTVAAAPAPVPLASSVPGPLAAGASVGNMIQGPYACAGTTLTFDQPSASAPGTRLATGLANGTVYNEFPMLLPALDRYEYGWVPTVFSPADKIAGETSVYDQFVNENELYIYRNQGTVRFDWATFGIVANTSDRTLCAIALGLGVSDGPKSGSSTYRGIGDGFALQNGKMLRLFGSTATATFDYATGSGTLQLDISGRDTPFGNFLAATPTLITVVGGAMSSSKGLYTGSVQSSDGRFKGTVTGSLFGPQAKGAGVAYALTDGLGTNIIGSAALAPVPPSA